jgi:hypothetical protein
MSHSEFMEWLMEIGGGWLGWSPEVVRTSHMYDIVIAYKGKVKMLQACYGSSEEKDKSKSGAIKQKPTLENFDAITGNT